MKTRFLNPAVEKEVRSDPVLFVAWGLTHGVYDDEIEPLHRVVWCEEAKHREAVDLVELKAKIGELQQARFHFAANGEEKLTSFQS
jgi:hypothetical protein